MCLALISLQEEGRKIAEECLRTAVNAIYEYHYYKKQNETDAANNSEGSAHSSNPPGYSLDSTGIFSFVPVIGSAAHVRYLETTGATTGAIDDESQELCKWYLQQLEDSKQIADSCIEALASTISVLRLSLAHDSRYPYVLQDDPESATRFIVYEHKLNEYFKILYEYTSEQFTGMCAAMREAFLSWKKIDKYLPREAKQQVPPRIGVKELLSAVMGR